MSDRKEPSTLAALFGMLLFAGGGIAFEMILWQRFGWEIALLPVCIVFAVVGYQLCWVPADGNAGTGGSGTGTGYVVQVNPEDPDAGIPRRGA